MENKKKNLKLITDNMNWEKNKLPVLTNILTVLTNIFELEIIYYLWH